jgi:hypothetical protein
MKTRKFLSFLVFIVLILITLSSCCKWAGSNGVNEECCLNYSGRLLKKSYSDFDRKFGYETVINIDNGDSTMNIVKVFIPQRTWVKLPEPNDTIIVNIQYIKNIEYGSTKDRWGSFWDFQFNLCTGFTVEKDTVK